jgi:hypothetical protein
VPGACRDLILQKGTKKAKVASGFHDFVPFVCFCGSFIVWRRAVKFIFNAGKQRFRRFFLASSRPGVKKNTRTPCDARANKNRSAPSTGNHAKDSRHEITTEKIHPSAFPVTIGHALEAVTLNLHRHSQSRQGPVFILF